VQSGTPVIDRRTVHDGGLGSGKQTWAPRLEQVAVAFDLCYDAWPETFRQEIREYLMRRTDGIYAFRGEFATGEFSWDMLWHGALMLGGVAQTGLALWGEPGTMPPKPTSPADRPLVPEIAPAANYKPGPGVPVSKFVNDEMPAEWIYVGGYKPKPDEDPLAGLGGVAQARPDVGTKVAFRGREEAFRPLSQEKKGLYEGKIDVTEAIRRVYESISFFYTVIDNDRPRLVQFQPTSGLPEAYFAGVHRRSGEFMRLQKGLYPVMLRVTIGYYRPHGRALIKPRLVEGMVEQAEVRRAPLMAAYETEHADWQADEADWKSSGLDPATPRLFQRGRSNLLVVCRRSLAAGGFPPEKAFAGVEIIASHYVTNYRKMFGEDLSPMVSVRDSVLQKMLGAAYRPGQLPRHEEVRGRPALSNEGFARLFPLVPDAWRPAALAAWNRAADVTDAASVTKALGHDPVYAFLNYPLDLQEK
jgi:hypothetical protein